MKIIDFIKSKLIRTEKDYNHDQHLFLSDEYSKIIIKTREFKTWYAGNSSDLLEFYTEFLFKDQFKNIIYNRNTTKYFWAQSTTEINIKRVHDGLSRVIPDKLSEIVGSPKIDSGDIERLNDILLENDFIFKLNQSNRPLTLVEGWGGYKVSVDKRYKHPVIEFYEADDVRFVYDRGRLSKAIFINHYIKNDEKYVLFETRTLENGDLKIEFNAYKQVRNELEKCTKEDIGIEFEDVVITGINSLLAEHSKYYADVLNGESYGRSIFDGKQDLLDELDETLSIASRTNRLSTPVEYIDSELLERDERGHIIPPVRWDREYVLKNGLINSDGGMNPQNGIITTQAKINFNEYNERAQFLIAEICEGLIAPATCGLELSRKDNASAAREKEKATLVTRNNIIEQETKVLKKLFKSVLIADDYMSGNSIDADKYNDIAISYKEFSTPAFEDIIHSLAEGFNYGMLSPEEVVERLYRDNKGTEEHNKREIKYIKEQLDRKNAMFNQVEMPEDSNDDNSSQKKDNPDELLQTKK